VGRKTTVTVETERARRTIMDESKSLELRGLATTFADVKEKGGRLSIAVIHSKHIEMLGPHIPELEKIFGWPVDIVHLAILEEAYKIGGPSWRMYSDSTS
jgi:hypothetical protein